MLPLPRQVHVRRVHGGVALTWRAAADTVYDGTSGATRGAARAQALVQVREARPAAAGSSFDQSAATAGSGCARSADRRSAGQ
jgi:hypothetical protein